MKAVRCPSCKKEVAPDGKAFPFCSERCRLIDLGNWINGKYQIAGEPGSADGEPRGDDVEDEGSPKS
jgi:endogenous inhibitor of DNA gyrase (YacG/DUF329 family)